MTGAAATWVVLTAAAGPLEHAAARTPATRTAAALRTCFELRYNGVGDLARTHCRRVVALLLEVVCDVLAECDHVGDGGLESVGRRCFPEVAQHQHPGQHPGHRVHLVEARVLGRAAMGPFEPGLVGADVRTPRQAPPTAPARPEVVDNVA